MNAFIIITLCVLIILLAMYNGVIILQVEIKGKRYDESEILEIVIILLLAIPAYIFGKIIEVIKSAKLRGVK